MVKVSIIVPVYNTEKYLRKCLESLVNQTISNYEIIIVNDGSKDNSQNIIDEYVNNYPFIKSYIKKNGGLSDTRNYGLEKSCGEFISFIDSDDYIKDNMLEIMYNKAIKDKSDIVVCDSINVYPDNEILIKSNLCYTNNSIINYLISPPMACTRLFKKSLFDNIKFKVGIFYEDLELTPKLVKYTKNISFVEEGLYYYLQRDGSIMKQKKFNNKLLDIFSILDSNRILLYEDYPSEIEYMYITHLLRTASLRFLNYDNYKINLNKIVNIMKKYFPNWQQNVYYKKSSNKLKLICILVYKKQYKLLKFIKKLTNK